jgi:hypothetical protein
MNERYKEFEPSEKVLKWEYEVNILGKSKRKNNLNLHINLNHNMG